MNAPQSSQTLAARFSMAPLVRFQDLMEVLG